MTNFEKFISNDVAVKIDVGKIEFYDFMKEKGYLPKSSGTLDYNLLVSDWIDKPRKTYSGTDSPQGRQTVLASDIIKSSSVSLKPRFSIDGIEDGERFNLVRVEDGTITSTSPFYFKDGILFDKDDENRFKVYNRVIGAIMDGEFKPEKVSAKKESLEKRLKELAIKHKEEMNKIADEIAKLD